MPLRYDLRIYQGETFQLAIPVLDETENSVSVVGMSATGQIRALGPAAGTALYEWSVAAGNLTLSGTSVVLTVPADVSSAWTWRTGEYDVELVNVAAGTTTRLVEGLVIVHPEVTRD